MSFELAMEVRDYECDLQGIVNNSVYQNYFEHTRHKFIKDKGIDFAEMHERGIDLVIVEANMKFKVSLKSGDTFRSTIKGEKDGKIKYKFYQEIVNEAGKVSVIGEFTAVAIVNGKLSKCPEVDVLFEV